MQSDRSDDYPEYIKIKFFQGWMLVDHMLALSQYCYLFSAEMTEVNVNTACLLGTQHTGLAMN